MPYTNNFNSRFLAIIWIVSLLSGVYMTDGRSVKAADAPSPVEAPQGWQRLGPYGGLVIDIAYAPSDPNIIYALLRNKAVPVFKSTDNGKTWRFLSVPFEIFIPSNIVVSPVDPEIVFFCDAHALFRSTDGGSTWEKQDDHMVDLIRFSKANPKKLFGRTGAYTFIKSVDSGETWEVVADHYIQGFTLDPFNENRILATSKGSGFKYRGLYESTDDGVTWNLLGLEREYIDFLKFGKTPGVIYLIKHDDSVMWKSSDNGVTWSILTDAFASYIIDFDVTGTTTEELFVTVEDYGAAYESNILRSSDGGTTWQTVPSRWAYYLYEGVAIDPSDSNHFVGYQEGCGMHFTWDGGATWTQSGSVFPGIPLHRIGVSPVKDGLMHVQTVNGYNLRSLDAGQTWEFTNYKNEHSGGWGFAFCMNNDQGVYWLAYKKILQSLNGGLDWKDLTPADFEYPSSIAVHPDDDSILLCGSQHGVMIRSADAGQTWTEVYNAQNISVRIGHIQFKPLDSSVMYAGTVNWRTSEVKLLRSSDAGTTWVEVSRIPTMYLQDLTVTHTEPEILFESDGPRLLMSVNQGLDWELVRQDINLQSENCLVSARNPNWVWVTGSSFALSTDMGQNWDFCKRFAAYNTRLIDYEATAVMGPNWFPHLIFPSEVDGIWTRVEDMPPRIMTAGSHYDAETSMLHFNAWVTDIRGPEDVETVDILYDGQETGLRLYDDGTHGDMAAHDGLFHLSIPIEADDPFINIPYSLIAIDKNGLVSWSWPELQTTQSRGEQP